MIEVVPRQENGTTSTVSRCPPYLMWPWHVTNLLHALACHARLIYARAAYLVCLCDASVSRRKIEITNTVSSQASLCHDAYLVGLLDVVLPPSKIVVPTAMPWQGSCVIFPYPVHYCDGAMSQR
ncbi:hypothetical protein HAX54_021946 [Datura stramonium]|uniref:Uncharacterized protein n=1 Tax=Datura stramonium TaxID=4076 RepID=A0ABS8UTP8_DATST|nr:hypothetical protein [Datura stramonium]